MKKHFSDEEMRAFEERAAPGVLEEIDRKAALAERQRQAKLQTMLSPGTEQIIARAIRDGESPDEVALECLAALKESQASVQMMGKLRRDAGPANRVPASEAPFIASKPVSSGDGGETSRVNTLRASLAKVRGRPSNATNTEH